MSGNFTPGPWVLDKHGTIWAHGDGVDDGVCLVMDVFDADPERNSQHSEIAKANRCLIAAAPDLLEALVYARELINELGRDFPDAHQKFDGQWASYRDEFDTALKKARGQ